MVHRFSIALLCFTLHACGGAVTPAPSVPAKRGDETGATKTSDVVRLEPIAIDSQSKPGQSSEVYDARELLDRGNAELAAKRFGSALALYKQLIADFPSSALVVPAQYNAGLALEGLRRFDDAIARYLGLARRTQAGRDSIDAHIRAGSVAAELERWQDAARIWRAVAKRGDVSQSDLVEIHARIGFVMIEQKQYRAARQTLNKGLEIYRSAKELGHVDTLHFVAMSHFYLGEIPRRQFELIPIRMPESQLVKDIEAKAGLVNSATEHYSRAVRSSNVYWGTAAGYRLASMQHSFWRAMVRAPAPPQLAKSAIPRYRKKLHAAARHMMEKALSTHQRSVELARLHGAQNEWVSASEEKALEIAAILARESAGELVVPAPKKRETPARSLGEHYAPARFEL